MKMRLLAASLVSVALIVAAPITGLARAWLRSTFPTEFVTIVGVSVAGAIGIALVAALVRIRERRATRYAAIAAAITIGVSYSLISRSGIPEVDVVERVHFVEYGLITFLFYRVGLAAPKLPGGSEGGRPGGDLSMFILPVLAGIVVGTLEEWLQWFIPARVGEARDVLLNLVAIGCGLVFGSAIEPPPSFTPRLRPGSRTIVGLAAAAALIVFAAFVSAVHLGHVLTFDLPAEAPGARAGGVAFASHYSIEQLQALTRDRAARWRTEPPIVLKRFSREDQYMDEGLWHVRRRNQQWEAGDYARAWNENLILEQFFAPVLDTPSYAAPDASRWTPEQRGDAERRGAGMTAAFVSDAEPYPILAWPKPLFWSLTALSVLAVAAAGVLL